jgi:eukaryotic-like serine/threonine-protein kinase
MLYCLNPHCENRENPDELEVCQSCQTPLLIHERYHILGFLCERERAATELFYVTDIRQPGMIFVLKTLLSTDPKVRSLFKQEQLLSDRLIHLGIPKGYDSFTVLLENRQEILCLVMEHIPGKNLEQWVIENSPINQEQAIKWLKQLLATINYLHNQQIIHRDIKPANIICKPDGDLVLIDFGSAKQRNEAIMSNTVVGSFGFTAPEQSWGESLTQSDFYAIGKTLMYLLMGGERNRQNTFVPNQAISLALHKLLEDMTMHEAQDRPANARKILRRLHKIERATNHRQRLKTSLIFFAAGVICVAIAINLFLPIQPGLTKQACDKVSGDYISCGEKSFFSPNDLKIILSVSPDQKDKVGKMAKLKRKGIRQIIDQKWSEAAESLYKVWRETQDPEALIYLNNSKIHLEKKTQNYTIAVATGFNGENATGLNILRGVAYAQTEAIKSNIGLKVVLVNDQDDAAIAKSMAQELLERQEIIAVIGHNVSDATHAALEVYDPAPNKMVIISPTSTSETLNRYTNSSKHIFFRTVAKDQSTATSMVAYLVNKKIRKVAVFYNERNIYSKSLANEFRTAFLGQDSPTDDPTDDIKNSILEDHQQFHLSCLDCNYLSLKIDQAIESAKKQGAKAFVVIPDDSEKAGDGQSPSMNDAIDIVKTSKDVEIVTGDSMAGVLGLLTKEAVNRVTIVSPWEMRENKESELVKFWQQGTEPRPQINWDAYTSYNAAQVLITAMQQNQEQKLDRDTLQKLISATGFSTPKPNQVQFIENTGELKNAPPTLTTVAECNGKPVFLGVNESCD